MPKWVERLCEKNVLSPTSSQTSKWINLGCCSLTVYAVSTLAMSLWGSSDAFVFSLSSGGGGNSSYRWTGHKELSVKCWMCFTGKLPRAASYWSLLKQLKAYALTAQRRPNHNSTHLLREPHIVHIHTHLLFLLNPCIVITVEAVAG